MRLSAIILRVVSGLVLLFAGAVKLNDPAAYAIKLREYFDEIKQDASVRQDTLLISLNDGIKSLNVAPFRLVSGEANKTLLIRQILHINTPKVQVDSSSKTDSLSRNKKWKKNKGVSKKLPKPKTTYLVHVIVFFDGNPAGDTAILFKDSGTATLLSVQAKIRNQSVFQKSFKVIATATHPEQISRLNLESFMKAESRTFRFFSGAAHYSNSIAFSLCFLELMLGFALIFGWGKKFTLGLNAFLCAMLFSLSVYAFKKGTISDTGALGQGIRVAPVVSLIKDASLLAFALVLIFGHSYFTPLFSRKNGAKVMISLTVLSAIFGAYCYFLLPVWDVSPFKPGAVLNTRANYLKGGKADGLRKRILITTKDNKSEALDSASLINQTEKQSGRIESHIKDKTEIAVRQPNDSLAFFDPKLRQEVSGLFLNGNGFKWLLIVPLMENTYAGSSEKIRALHGAAVKHKMPFMAVTASPETKADALLKERQWPFNMVNADKNLLDRMAGFNPTLYLLKGNVVVKKWSGLNLPQASYISGLKAK